MTALCLLGTLLLAPAAPLRHTPDWVTTRVKSMLAVDDAYLWHDVLGGRAIHQNSLSVPPTTPLQGNFHTQQQSFFALMKMHAQATLKPADERWLDEARTLLDWVVTNGYDQRFHTFYLKYNQPTDAWQRDFFPEFNAINVAALLRYDSLRPTPAFKAAAEDVFRTITTVAWDEARGGFWTNYRLDETLGRPLGGSGKSLYTAGYLALMFLDAYDSTGDPRFLAWTRKAVDPCNQHLWDNEFGGWYLMAKSDWSNVVTGTKYTHIIADMIQANALLCLYGQGDGYRQKAVDGMEFLLRHARREDGAWYRHTNRDGTDPQAEPVGGGDGGPGTVIPYDRQMQCLCACCLLYEITGEARYLEAVDATLDVMEHSHLMTYPAGVNYGYMGPSSENTWCHLWGLEGFLTIAELQAGGRHRPE